MKTQNFIKATVGIFLAVVSFIAIAFVNSFVTKAEYNKDFQVITEIKRDLCYIKESLGEIKQELKDIKR